MIIDFFINITLGGIPQLMTMLPPLSLPASTADGLNEFLTVVGQFNSILPISTVFVILGAVVAFHSASLAWYGINWVVRKIPTIS